MQKKSKNRQKSVLILEDFATKLWKEGKRQLTHLWKFKISQIWKQERKTGTQLDEQKIGRQIEQQNGKNLNNC